MRLAILFGCSLLLAFGVMSYSQELPSPGPIRSLGDFGPLDTPAKAQATYEKAIAEQKKKGGILFVPSNVWKSIKDIPLQGLIRTPLPPEETKQWKIDNGVTVVVVEEKQTSIEVPPLTGLHIDRKFRLGDLDSSPHWGTHPMITLNSQLSYGSTSYLDWLQVRVEKGKDRKFYVPTVRGLRPGMFINAHGKNGYGGGVARIYIKSVGFDAQKGMHYFVADTHMDHEAGAIVHNKTNSGILNMIQTSNNDNQTYDVKVARNQYAHGDTYIYYCDFNYMSNVHSAAGDENGNCFAAFIRSKEDNFRAKIEAVDWEKSQIKFSSDARNIHTLGDSRPIINLNPSKAITQGTVIIVPAENYIEATDTGKYKFEGKTYPTVFGPDPKTNVKGNRMGGLIRGDKETAWTDEVVGRYFAVTSPEEKTPKGSLRWYEITGLKKNPDGTRDLEIRRYWWGAKNAGSPTLYSPESYTWDGHVRPLSYVIAPGTYVNDVSRALPGGERGGQRLLGVAGYSDQGSKFDFEKGDPVEQAIGPDPFKPQPFRVWMWEDVPGVYPSSVFDLANNGAASRSSVMYIRGGAVTMEEVEKRKEKKPAWDNYFIFATAATVGLNCKADFADAAILFQQPNREQPIKWLYDRKEGAPAKEAVLTVSKTTGELNFQGGGVRANGGVAEVKGISGDNTQAKNLRGKNVAVAEKETSVRITFPEAESDGDYAVFIEQTWLTNRAISDKRPDGFTITFSAAAPAEAKLDWMIVR